MGEYSAGAVLTCTHEHCNCRVVIVDECHCEEVDDQSLYRCACGAPLVRVREDESDAK